MFISPKLFDEGIMPAVDVGKSVSRVEGKTQLPLYRSVGGICAFPIPNLRNLRLPSGIFDYISLGGIEGAKKKIREEFRKKLPERYQRIQSREKLENGDRQSLIEMCVSALHV